VDRDTVDVLDEPVSLALFTEGGGEDLHCVSASAQLGGEVVRLDLDPAQPGQVTVRQQGHLHGHEPAMRQDGS
jgi:hypothetical protein